MRSHRIAQRRPFQRPRHFKLVMASPSRTQQRRISITGVDWVFARRSHKRQQQHPRQAFDLEFVAMLSDSDGHVDVAGSRLIAVGAQQVIPPREIEP